MTKKIEWDTKETEIERCDQEKWTVNTSRGDQTQYSSRPKLCSNEEIIFVDESSWAMNATTTNEIIKWKSNNVHVMFSLYFARSLSLFWCSTNEWCARVQRIALVSIAFVHSLRAFIILKMMCHLHINFSSLWTSKYVHRRFWFFFELWKHAPIDWFGTACDQSHHRRQMCLVFGVPENICDCD